MPFLGDRGANESHTVYHTDRAHHAVLLLQYVLAEGSDLNVR